MFYYLWSDIKFWENGQMKYPYYIFPVIVLEKIKLKGEPQSQAKLQEKDLLAIRSIDVNTNISK